MWSFWIGLVHTYYSFFCFEIQKSQWTMSTDLFYTQVTLSLWLLNHVSFEHNDTIEPDVMLLLGGIEDMKDSPKHWCKVQNIKIFAILMHCKSFPSQLDVVWFLSSQCNTYVAHKWFCTNFWLFHIDFHQYDHGIAKFKHCTIPLIQIGLTSNQSSTLTYYGLY